MGDNSNNLNNDLDEFTEDIIEEVRKTSVIEALETADKLLSGDKPEIPDNISEYDEVKKRDNISADEESADMLLTDEVVEATENEKAITVATPAPDGYQDVFVDKSVYEKNNSKKKVKKFFAVFGISVLSVAVIAYVAVAVWFMFHFNRNTYIDGEDVSLKTVASVNNVIDNYIDNYSMNIVMRDDEHTIVPSDIGMVITPDFGVEEAKKMQNSWLWFLYIGDSKKEYDITYNVTYDEDKLNEYLDNLACLLEENMDNPENAYVIVEDGKAEVVPETEGTVIDKDIFKQDLCDALNMLNDIVDLTESDCYEVAAVTSDSDKIQEITDELNKYLDMVITYKIDDVSWTLDASTFGDWLYYRDGWYFKELSIKKYVKEIAETYNTVGTERTFKTHSGRTVYETGSKYGWIIDEDAEALGLGATLAEGISQERTPEFSQVGYAYTKYDDIGDTYVEVDLTNQKVYLVVDSKVIVDTSCVTGCEEDGNGTPDGLYGITYKKSPDVLKGEGYSTKVNYWMPFNRGIGLHDATWRSKFGGDIYVEDGSHGCVNLPLDSAAEIYDYVEANMPVICYY
jgi:hypothetical protein